jgi:hypothetical protein
MGLAILIIASVNIKETEIDFGTTPTLEKTFNVIDAEVTTGSQILLTKAMKSPSSGRDIDEIRAESLELTAKALAGSFDLNVKSLSAVVTGKFIINYLVG